MEAGMLVRVSIKFVDIVGNIRISFMKTSSPPSKIQRVTVGDAVQMRKQIQLSSHA